MDEPKFSFQDRARRLQEELTPLTISETSSHLPSLGALPLLSPERQEEPRHWYLFSIIITLTRGISPLI